MAVEYNTVLFGKVHYFNLYYKLVCRMFDRINEHF